MTSLIIDWIYKHLGDDFWGDGGSSPPGTLPRLEFGELDDDGKPMYIATTYNNDGFELWLGTHNKWYVFYRDRYARRLAWFILYDWWAKSTWFGLKRKIWYWALHETCERYKTVTGMIELKARVDKLPEPFKTKAMANIRDAYDDLTIWPNHAKAIINDCERAIVIWELECRDD